MLLRNLKITGDNRIVDVLVKNGAIHAVDTAMDVPIDNLSLHFDDVIAFPGLINSHDHLDFNLFPQLGNKLHNNYVEWGRHIHAHNKDTISKMLQIPQSLRVQWGIYKNLVSGITTVVDHGLPLQVNDDIITIFQQYHFLHSIRLHKFWKYKLNKPFIKKQPFVIHIGEGNDVETHNEIDTLAKWNLRKRDIVGVHGIAMNEKQASFFKALVWCPASNIFMIGKTAPIDRLKDMTDIVFGTDSALSAGWNLWDHLRLARSQNMVSDKELYNMLTSSPADVWDMKKCGKIETDYDADIVIAKKKPGLEGYDALYSLNPEDILLVMHKGDIRLFDAGLLQQLSSSYIAIQDFSRIIINGAVKYVYGDVPALMKQIKSYNKEIVFPFEGEEAR